MAGAVARKLLVICPSPGLNLAWHGFLVPTGHVCIKKIEKTDRKYFCGQKATTRPASQGGMGWEKKFDFSPPQT
jgi:hypothetical protein